MNVVAPLGSPLRRCYAARTAQRAIPTLRDREAKLVQEFDACLPEKPW